MGWGKSFPVWVSIAALSLLLGLVFIHQPTMPIDASHSDISSSLSFSPTALPALPEKSFHLDISSAPARADFQSNPTVVPDLTKLVDLQVKDWVGVQRIAEPVINGVPLPKGQVTALSQLQILVLNNGTYTEIPSQFEIQTKWPDNSLRWVQVMFFADTAPNSSATYYLHYGPQVSRAATHPNPLVKTETSTFATLTTGNYEIGIDKTKGTIFDYVKNGSTFIIPQNSTTRGFQFTDDLGNTYTTRNAPTSFTWEEDGPLTKLLKVTGIFQSASGSNYMGYIMRIRFFAGTSRTNVSMVFENRGAATAPQNVAPGMAVNYSKHRWFVEGKYVTDLSLGATKTLQLTPAYSVSNYQSGTYEVLQDATPAHEDYSVPPTFSGFNTDATVNNLLDNVFVKVRGPQGATPDALLYSAGPANNSTASTGNPNVLPAPNALLEGGPFSVSDGTNRMEVYFKDFWQTFPKTYTISTPSAGANSSFEIGFWPLDNTHNDLYHDLGPIHHTASFTNTTNFYGWGGNNCSDPTNNGCAVIPRSTTSYNLLSGKAFRYQFVFNFDSGNADSGVASRASAFQHPLIALAPPAYYGPSFSNAFMDPLYVEARNWSNETLDSDSQKNATLRVAANLTDKWGKSIWDDASVCTSTTTPCYSLNKTRSLGSGFSTAGYQHYGWSYYGEFVWAGDSPIKESYSHLEADGWQAMRTRDSRAITEFPADQWTIYSSWRFDQPSNAAVGFRVYQKGDNEVGADSSSRHSLNTGDAIRALLTSDRDIKDSMMYDGREAGFYGFNSSGNYDPATGKTLAQVLANPPWGLGSGTQLIYASPYYGSGYPAKAMRDILWLYEVTGDSAYLTIAKGWITNMAKPWMDGCHAKYGTWFFLAANATLSNWTASCPFVNGTNSGSQVWQDGYMLQAIMEILERDKAANGVYDPVLYPWFIQVLQGQFAAINAYVPAQTAPYNYYFDGPNTFVVDNRTNLTQAQALADCGAGFNVGNPNYNDVGITPLNGGNTPATMVTCWHTYYNTSNYFYSAPGFAWLYLQTGDPAVLNLLKIQFRDTVMFNFRNTGSAPYPITTTTVPAEVPTWRLGSFGGADIKGIAPITHMAYPMLAAMVYPVGSTTVVPTISNITPSSVTTGNAFSFTLTGTGFTSTSTIRVGSGSTQITVTPTTWSSTQLAASLTANQVNSVAGSSLPVSVPVQVVDGSLTSNIVNFTVNSVASNPAPSLTVNAPVAGAVFTAGSPIAFSATVSLTAPAQTVVTIYRHLGSQPNLGANSPDIIYTTTITPGSSGTAVSYTDSSTATETAGTYYWQMTAVANSQTTQSQLYTYTLNAQSTCTGSSTACANQVGVCAGSVSYCSNLQWVCDAGSYGANYHSPETNYCNDGLDNDCDGAVDCSDQDCVGASNCQVSPPTCGNGTCNASAGETCLTCGIDCGACPPTTSPPSNSGPGSPGGGGGGSPSDGGYFPNQSNYPGGDLNLIRGTSSNSPGGNLLDNLFGLNPSANPASGSTSTNLSGSPQSSNPIFNALNDVGSTAVGAFSADAAGSYGNNVLAGFVIVILAIGGIAYFFGLL